MEKSIPSPIKITANIEVKILRLPRVNAVKPAVHIIPVIRVIPARIGATHIRKDNINKASISNRARTDVIYNRDLLATIVKYQAAIIPNASKNKIYRYLANLNIKEKSKRKEHIRRIKEKESESKIKIKNNICPKCGALLVIRNGRYGEFKGCRNYPDCRFTANL